MNKCELLAPAGDIEALKTAIEYGADAVYVGGSSFSARAQAVNFSNEELAKAVDYCHINNVMLYVAVNTLVSDREMSELDDYIRYISEIGVDGVIVQDLGVAEHIRNVAPTLPLHASTQMTVTDLAGIKLLEKLGFKRAVLARELSCEEIENICKNTDMEIEIFVHGAICVCYSGQCLMSSFIGGRSGNRGKCAQPCRQLYSMNEKNGYLISPKDMCLINHLKSIEASGVKSLKIEGRMKGTSYVSTVVSMYRKYLDKNEFVSSADYRQLESIFYRGGFTDGYYTGKTGEKMFCVSKPDNPYLKQNTDFELFKPDRKRSISFEFSLELNKPLKLTVRDKEGRSAEVNGEFLAEVANNAPLDKERVIQQLTKLGGTNFKADEVIINIGDGLRIPVSEINNARRNVLSLLENEILKSYKRSDSQYFKKEKAKRKCTDNKSLEIAVFVTDKNQLLEMRKLSPDVIYVPYNFTERYEENEIAVLPRVNNNDIEQIIKSKNIKTALARNLGQIEKLKQLGVKFIADSTLNIFNNEAFAQFKELGAECIVLSNELTLKQIADIEKNIPAEVTAYGKIPVMVTKNCLVKSGTGKCTKGGMLKDKTGAEFYIRCLENCGGNEIYNSYPVNMSDKTDDIKESGVKRIRLIFTTESPKECVQIYNAFKNGVKYENGEFTRGKFYKGV